MKWGAQVVHVAAKDIRHLKWPLISSLVYIAWAVTAFVADHTPPVLTYLTAQNAFGVSSTGRGFGGVLTAVVLVLLGLILSASALQLDSPERVEAFWATRPFSPTAVLMAKIATVGVAIILPVLVGAFVTLVSLDAHGSSAMRTIIQSGVGYGQWLLAAMVLAALTDSLAAFVLTFIGVGAALIIMAMRAEVGTRLGMPSVPGIVFSAIGVVLSLAILMFLYTKHESGILIRIAGWVAAACLLLGALLDPLPYRSSRDFGNAPDLRSGPQLSLQLVDTGAGRRGQTGRIMALSAPDSLRLLFQLDTIRMRSRSGAEGLSMTSQLVVVAGGRPPLDGYVWKSSSPGRASTGIVSLGYAMLGGQITSETMQGVHLSGSILVSHPHIVAGVPLKPGARLEYGGRRVEIYSVTRETVGRNVVVRSLSLSGNPAEDQPSASESGVVLPFGSQWPISNLQFVLVNDQQREALPLINRGGGTGPGAMILPWFSAVQSFSVLGTRDSLTSPSDSAWFANARLIAVEWTPVGRYHTTLSATVP